jgi:hypothetical protein
MTSMPLRGFRGSLPPLSQNQADIRDRLSQTVHELATVVGERNMEHAASLDAAELFLEQQLRQSDYTPRRLPYAAAGKTFDNIEACLPGADEAAGRVVIGAHYDSVIGTPGADDNATGVAAGFELARSFRSSRLRRTICFVFFVNEEPPWFQTHDMGSFVYARQLRNENVSILAMLSLETIGFYSDAKDSQKYPPVLGWFYPNRGNFIGFVGNEESRALVRQTVRDFRQAAQFPAEGIAAPADWPGIGWSDQWSFWQAGYPAVMVTDTAPFRNPNYHRHGDTEETLDLQRTARVVDGLHRVVEQLANQP